jgi:cytochrome c
MKFSGLFLSVALGVGLCTPALANDDMTALGEKVYKKCRTCHSIEPGKKKLGPSLYGLYGSTAGTVAGVPYSPAMKSSGVVWNDETLDAFLTNPKKFMPKTRMSFPGLKKEEDRAAIIALMKGL